MSSLSYEEPVVGMEPGVNIVWEVIGKDVLRVVIMHIAKSQSQGNCSGLREFGVGYSPRIVVHKVRNRQVRLRLVLVQKRTRLEFLRRRVGRLYT